MKTVLALFVFGLSTQAMAWGDLGHSTVGYIAEYKLTAKAKRLVYDIIGTEPLAVSATWPDHVRSDARYLPFAIFHYMSKPYGRNYSEIPVGEREVKSDVDTYISQIPDLLIDKQISREKKMFLLRYLVHLVGDVHQPLHIGNGHDRGGNLCDVNWKNPVTEKIEKWDLHSVWDSRLFDNIEFDYRAQMTKPKSWFGYREMGDMILKEFSDLNYTEVSQTPIDNWYNESQDLHKIVYLDGETLAKPQERVYCKFTETASSPVMNGAYDSTKIPLISDEYVKSSIPVVKKRIIQAGYRLAGILNAIAEKTKLAPWSLDEEKKFFDSLILTSKETKKKK